MKTNFSCLTSDPSHSHFDDDSFSDKDKLLTAMATARNPCHRTYLGTPSGKFKKYTVLGGETTL